MNKETQEELLTRIIAEGPSPEKKNPTITYVEIHYKFDDGRVEKKFIDGETARIWQQWTQDVSVVAKIHNGNPPFHTLEWHDKKIT